MTKKNQKNMKEYDKQKSIKEADLIDVSDKPAVSNIRAGIPFMFSFLSETGDFSKRRMLEKPQYCSEYPE